MMMSLLPELGIFGFWFPTNIPALRASGAIRVHSCNGLARARSLGPRGPSASPNSFRRFPSGSSRVRGRELKRNRFPHPR